MQFKNGYDPSFIESIVDIEIAISSHSKDKPSKKEASLIEKVLYFYSKEYMELFFKDFHYNTLFRAFGDHVKYKGSWFYDNNPALTAQQKTLLKKTLLRTVDNLVIIAIFFEELRTVTSFE